MKKNVSRKGFTIIELLIVIVIIWVLMVAFRNIFQTKNKDILFWESCVNNLYGDVSNYFYSAITSKAVYSGTTLIYPSTYYIEYNVAADAIRLAYAMTDGGTILTGKYLSLTGTVPSNYNCKTNGYYILLSGKFLQIKVNKWLNEDGNLRSMTLSGDSIADNTFTASMKFLLIYPKISGYKELGRFEVDTRTQSIKNIRCLIINSTGDCSSRDGSIMIN